MRHIAVFPVCIICAMLLASCNRSVGSSAELNMPAELRGIMEASRAVALPPRHPGFEEIAAGFLTPAVDAEADSRLAMSIRQRWFQPRPDFPMVYEPCPTCGRYMLVMDLSRAISREEAADEVRLLFDIMRYAYAGYQYFGRDAVFLPMRDALLERLALPGDPVPLWYYLNELLAPALHGAIADSHFRVHNVEMGAPRYAMRMSDEFVLRRSGDGFVAEIGGAAHAVAATALRDGTPVDAVVPTITRDGEFAHAFGLFARADDPGAREIVVSFGGERCSRIVRLSPLAGYAPYSRPTLETREEGGIPVVVTRNFSSGEHSGMTRIAFERSGAAMRDEPLAIIDLRGNSGGSRNHVGSWIDNYARERPNRELTFVDYLLSTSTLSAVRRQPMLGADQWSRLRWPDGHSAGEFVANENAIIVLADNEVFSAGEYFLGLLRQIDNVLVVGTNTRGALVSSRTTGTTLPHSGFALTFGTSLNLRPDLSQFEGVGFLPDLWVPPGESLERVLAFVERYGLNR